MSTSMKRGTVTVREGQADLYTLYNGQSTQCPLEQAHQPFEHCEVPETVPGSKLMHITEHRVATNYRRGASPKPPRVSSFGLGSSGAGLGR